MFLTSSPPTAKQKIAALIAPNGAGFVDGALMGGLTLNQHKVPTLVSGSGASKFIEMMIPYHMSLEKVSDKAGDAIAFCEDMMNFLVTASTIHTERQTHEMADSMVRLKDLGIAPIMTEATILRLKWLADKKLKDIFQGKVPAKWEDVVSAWGV